MKLARVSRTHVELPRLPQLQTFAKLVGVARRVAGSVKGFERKEPSRLMMPVPVIGSTAPRRNDHKRTERADHTNHISKHGLAVPFQMRLLERHATTDINCERYKT